MSPDQRRAGTVYKGAAIMDAACAPIEEGAGGDELDISSLASALLGSVRAAPSRFMTKFHGLHLALVGLTITALSSTCVRASRLSPDLSGVCVARSFDAVAGWQVYDLCAWD